MPYVGTVFSEKNEMNCLESVSSYPKAYSCHLFSLLTSKLINQLNPGNFSCKFHFRRCNKNTGKKGNRWLKMLYFRNLM